MIWIIVGVLLGTQIWMGISLDRMNCKIQMLQILQYNQRKEWTTDCTHCLYQTEPGCDVCKECKGER